MATFSKVISGKGKSLKESLNHRLRSERSSRRSLKLCEAEPKRRPFRGFQLSGLAVDTFEQESAENRDLEQMYHTLRFQIVFTELDLAITFGEVAAATRDELRSQASRADAEKAYHAAMRFARGAELTARMRSELVEKIMRLKSLLAEI